MPHKCIRCMQVFSDSSHEILQGCLCGSKAFLYTRDPLAVVPTAIMDSYNIIENSSNSSSSSSNDVFESIVSSGEFENSDDAFTVDVQALLDKKTIHSTEDGKYSLNLDAIFAGQRPKL